MIVDGGPESLEEVLAPVNALLEANTLLALAVQDNAGCWVATVFFSYDKDLNLYFISDPKTRHGQAIATEPRVAGAIYGSDVRWGTDIQGLQIRGTAERVALHDMLPVGAAYLRRFPIATKFIHSPEWFNTSKISSRLYRIRPSQVQLYDEVTFGSDNPIRRLDFDK